MTTMIRQLRQAAHTLFNGPAPQFLQSTLVISIGHLNSATVHLFTLLKEYGLRQAVIGEQGYSTDAHAAEQLDRLELTRVKLDHCPLAVDHALSMDLHCRQLWRIAETMITRQPIKWVIILDHDKQLHRCIPASLLRAGDSLPIITLNSGNSQRMDHRLPPHASPCIHLDQAHCIIQSERRLQGAHWPIQTKKIVQEILAQSSQPKTIGMVLNDEQQYHWFTKGSDNDIAAYCVILSEPNNTKQQMIFPNCATLIANCDIVINFADCANLLGPEAMEHIRYKRSATRIINASNHVQALNNLALELPYPDSPTAMIIGENHLQQDIMIWRGGYPLFHLPGPHQHHEQGYWARTATVLLTMLDICQRQRITGHLQGTTTKIQNYILRHDPNNSMLQGEAHARHHHMATITRLPKVSMHES